MKPDSLKNPHLIHFGRKVEIYPGARLEVIRPHDDCSPRLIIGEGTKIMYYFHCGVAEKITIGNNVLIASRVYITDHDHVFDDPHLSPRENPTLTSSPVVLEDGCWIGEGAVILKGVRVGHRAVVGANSVVTRDVLPWTVVGGIPARILKRIES